MISWDVGSDEHRLTGTLVADGMEFSVVAVAIRDGNEDADEFRAVGVTDAGEAELENLIAAIGGDAPSVIINGREYVVYLLLERFAREVVEHPASSIELPPDLWDTHPEYEVADWQHDVREGHTRLGYWDWVRNQ
jgi:hypothetical protein